MVGRFYIFLMRWALALTVLFPLVAAAADQVVARVDRNIMREGETVNFVLQSSVSGDPDFSPLGQDFDILSTAQSSQMSFINGKMDSRIEWTLILSPKRSGRLSIPPITVGKGHSQALSVNVVPAGQGTASGNGGDLFVEAEATPASAYVQSQIVYTVRLFQGVDIREGGLSEPHIDDAVVERLGDDATYTTTRNGRQYRVTERRYAIFPQTSGELVIPPTVLTAQIVDSRGSGQVSPDPFSRFFQQPALRPVRLRTKPVHVQVQPKPAAAGSTWWLPAESVTLRESWTPATPKFRVGESVTRTLTLETVGVTGAQLPQIAAEDVDGIKRYADQPVTATGNNGSSLVGTRTEKVALVPTRAGRMVLPEIRIAWWDTHQNKTRVAVLPSRTIEVLPTATSAAPAAPAPVAVPPRATAPVPLGNASGPAGHWAAYLPWFSAFLFFGWMATLVAWWFSRKRPPQNNAVVSSPATQEESVDLKAARQRLKKAAQNHSAAGVKEALLAWGRARWPDAPPTSLGAVAERLDDAALKAQVDALNRSLYAGDDARWDGTQLWQAFQQAGKITRPAAAAQHGLPELYPQRRLQE